MTHITIIHKDTKDGVLYINLEKPKDYKHTILWSHGGMYSLVPLARIQNMIREYQDRLLLDGEPESCLAVLRYADCIPVMPDVAKALIGETP